MAMKITDRQYLTLSVIGLVFVLMGTGWLFFYTKWLLYSPLIGGIISVIVLLKASKSVHKKIAWVTLVILFLEIAFVGYLYYSLFHGGFDMNWQQPA